MHRIYISYRGLYLITGQSKQSFNLMSESGNPDGLNDKVSLREWRAADSNQPPENCFTSFNKGNNASPQAATGITTDNQYYYTLEEYNSTDNQYYYIPLENDPKQSIPKLASYHATTDSTCRKLTMDVGGDNCDSPDSRRHSSPTINTNLGRLTSVNYVTKV